ncbi:MAG: (Na+)-NQR maturation NqrM [Porticoccaceae bacterium]|jgi:hypothetical protein|nr:(Na+)-NQR maturation NqrM [Porticoccaceae bacterium]MDG1749867.1 (Na+)-NQR maturation NqrM [Porticoccaceae bacterium]|tara:strand:- start:4898 stop:5110 length:213 start_codon:yes stop_codon:yes gene_type:complete
MIEVILSIVIFGLLITGMAVGVLLGRKPISGSCGGVGAALGEKDYSCDICGGDIKKCEDSNSERPKIFNP